MKYFAAPVSEEEIAATVVMPPYRILLSYYYFQKKPELIKQCLGLGYEVFIDSGAFSAESKKLSINIDAYCRFLLDTKCPLYAGLDVIGNAQATFKNVKYMEDKYSLTPIPTFHIGSDLKELYNMIENYDYIALGGLVFSSNLFRYCDEIWSIILNKKPSLRVHGFGMTNIELMERYPWYSVDSSSYKGCRRFGRQNILYNDFEWKTIQEDDYLELLKKQGHKLDESTTNKERYFLYDYNSVQSYKLYGAHLDIVNKTKDFGYLTARQKLF